MFDINKLADVSKLASQARKVQEKQEDFTRRQLDLLEGISKKLDMLIDIARKDARG